MKLNNIYIVSWFGNDPELAKKRRAVHLTQLDWCKKHNLHPVIYAQGYNESDYVDGPTYIKHTGSILHPGPARNVLLQHFYQSDDDFGVFADNDGILYEGSQHGDSANYIKIMRSLPIEEFTAIDLIDPLNPARMAFAKEIQDDIYKTNLVYRRANKIKGTLFFLKNIKKYKDTELFFDEVIFNDNGKMLPGEDTEFCLAALFKGLGCYYTYNAIVNELATEHSTWTSTNEHSNIVPIYEMMNSKYGCTLYKIPEDIVKTFKSIGYSFAPDGKCVFRLAINPDERRKIFEKFNHTNITFYDIPGLPIEDAIQYALANIEDPVLQGLLEKQIKSKKTFINRGKNRIKFNWLMIPPTIPMTPNKIIITK